MNDDALAQSNYHVAAGDILLLRSRGKGMANRLGQWLKRRRPARFTHVAIVVNYALIVDSMPEIGVTFRKWRDIEGKYDIGACRVARHRQLLEGGDASGRVLQKALYYTQQPYKLWNVFLDSRAVKDQSGLVCSHFVGVLLKDLGVDASDRAPTATLPVDIDRFTRRSSDWHQFPMAEYGLYSGSQRPPHGDPYWAQLKASFTILSPDEDEAALSRTADELGATPEHSGTMGLAANRSHVDESMARGDIVISEFLDGFIGVVDLIHKKSQLLARVDEETLKLRELVLSRSPEAIVASEAIVSAARSLGKDRQLLHAPLFLKQWKALFLDADGHRALFLGDETWLSNFPRYRDDFLRTLALNKELARNQLEAFASCKNLMGVLLQMIQNGAVNVGLMDRLLEVGKRLLASSWFLGGETIEALQARIDAYPTVHKDTLHWAGTAAPELVQQAIQALLVITDIDLDRLSWLAGCEPILRKWVDTLESALALQTVKDGASAG